MPTPNEMVVLVDRNDREIGVMEKLQAHREAALHRAVSVFVRDSSGRYILQQRAAGKYHAARLWSNTACGHPRPNENVEAAAARRLRDEMGIATTLRHVGTVTYRLRVGDLIEHEIDHVFVGDTENEPRPDPGEVMAWRTISLPALEQDLRDHPERYTPWLEFVLSSARIV